jgi:uncharacterized sulfatase
VYLRNYMPHLPAGQHLEYQMQTKTTQVWKKLFDLGKLNEAQSVFWKAPRPPEELYDLNNDPDEVKNLAGLGSHHLILTKYRLALRAHQVGVRDIGFLPEDEIHRRSAGSTPYDLGHDAKKYNLDRIIATADLNTSSERLLVLAKSFTNAPDSGERYWFVQALLRQGKDAVVPGKSVLRVFLKDESPSIRVLAAEALATHGVDDADAGLKLLLAHADAKKNSLYVSLAALNAIDRLGEKARPIAAEIRKLPTEPTDAKHRAAMGVSRLLTSIQKQLAP